MGQDNTETAVPQPRQDEQATDSAENHGTEAAEKSASVAAFPRRVVLGTAGAGTITATMSTSGHTASADGRSRRNRHDDQKQLDRAVRAWWPEHKGKADEKAVRKDSDLLFLPFPIHSGGNALPGWDTFFTNLGLMEHGLSDAARDQVLNQLFEIQRFGYVPNGNQHSVLTRSHPPLWAEGTRRYIKANDDEDMTLLAYPTLKREHDDYWKAKHHSTSVGLTTDYDNGDPNLSPVLAAEAATGLDFTPIFGGDVRRCVPVQTNAILVTYEQTLEWMANRIGRDREARRWHKEWTHRSALIRRYCWSKRERFFFEYDYVAKKRLPYWSLCAYWTMWAGVATRSQAHWLVRHLDKFEQPFGLACTDRSYPDPHDPPENFWLQWQYPTGWPPMHIMVVQALKRYGYQDHARRIAKKYVDLMSDLYLHRGDTVAVAANRGTSDSAPTLSAGHTFGQRFTTTQKFTRAGGQFSAKGSNVGMRLTLRRDGPNGAVITSTRFENVSHNTWLHIDLDESAPAGTYFLEQSHPEGKIAWHTSSKDAYSKGSAYRDGSATDGDRVFAVERSTGKGTGELWEKYNVVEGSLNLPPAHYSQIWTNQGWSYGAAAVLGSIAYGS